MYSHFSCAGLQAGKSLLMYASQFGHEESVRALIEKGTNVEAVDKRGNTALQLASDYGYRKVAKLLCKHGARGALWYAAKNDLRDMVAELILKGKGLEECDKDGNTALQLASKYSNRKVAKMLCKHGARGALCYAAKNDLRDMVTELISKGHDLEECDNHGNTALQLASDNGKGEMAKVLCKHGARGALCYSAKNDLRSMVEELILKGYELEECDKDGKTALDLAAEANDGEGHSKVVGLLIKAGIEAGQWQDVNACLGSAGKTLLMYASQCGQEQPVRVLIEKGASLEAVDKNGETALMLASRNGHTDTVRVLVQHDVSIDAVYKIGNKTALQIAEEEGESAVVAVLKEQYVARGLTVPVYEEKEEEQQQQIQISESSESSSIIIVGSGDEEDIEEKEEEEEDWDSEDCEEEDEEEEEEEDTSDVDSEDSMDDFL
jgi:ankyrin repeat protein